MEKEEYGIVIEYFPYGVPGSGKNKPVSILLVDDASDMSLLLAYPKHGVNLTQGQRVYIGSGKREEIGGIIGKADLSVLSEMSAEFLKNKVNEIVSKNEEFFINVINRLGPINIRLNAFELIPGIGKKLVEKISAERAKGPFKSFEDFNTRVGGINIKERIVERILQEFNNVDKYKLFTR
ncbi:MAG: DUF655 domain-containing protein [Candidatus Parvarchaeota archaeon]|nr:DUF655 domain-containing protein [Candidatus Rehaiarchaeum fermentans]